MGSQRNKYTANMQYVAGKHERLSTWLLPSTRYQAPTALLFLIRRFLPVVEFIQSLQSGVHPASMLGGMETSMELFRGTQPTLHGSSACHMPGTCLILGPSLNLAVSIGGSVACTCRCCRGNPTTTIDTPELGCFPIANNLPSRSGPVLDCNRRTCGSHGQVCPISLPLVSPRQQKVLQ